MDTDILDEAVISLLPRARRTCARSTSSFGRTATGCESFPGSSPSSPYLLGHEGPRPYDCSPDSGFAGSSTTASAARRECGDGRTGSTPSTSLTARWKLTRSCLHPRCWSMSEDRSGNPRAAITHLVLGCGDQLRAQCPHAPRPRKRPKSAGPNSLSPPTVSSLVRGCFSGEEPWGTRGRAVLCSCSMWTAL